MGMQLELYQLDSDSELKKIFEEAVLRASETLFLEYRDIIILPLVFVGFALIVWRSFCWLILWMSTNNVPIISCFRITFGSSNCKNRSALDTRSAPTGSFRHKSGYFFHRLSNTLRITSTTTSRWFGGARGFIIFWMYWSASWNSISVTLHRLT